LRIYYPCLINPCSHYGIYHNLCVCISMI
jgi:hypothetical protein